MNSHEYDTSGVSSSLLGIGLLLAVMAATCTKAFSRAANETFACRCSGCSERKRKRPRVNIFLGVFVLASVLLAVLVRNVIAREYTREGTFDPYDLLSVSRSAKKKEIDRAYRRRVREARLSVLDKKKCKKIVQSILKAHSILADRKKREKWDAFGETDAKERHIVAIPHWVMTKHASLLFILAYILILGVILPKVASYIWQISFAYSYAGVSYRSTEALYHKMKYVKKCFAVETVVGWISECCVELSEHRWRTRVETINHLREVLEEERAVALKKDAAPPLFVCHSLFALKNPRIRRMLRAEDIEHAQEIMLKSLKAVRIISLALRKKEIFYLTYDLERCLVQSVPDPKYWEMQYPGAAFEDVFTRLYEKKKEDLPLDILDKEIDAKMFRAKITAVDMYTPVDGPVTKEEHVSGEASLNIRAVVTREGSASLYSPPLRKKTRKEEADIGDLSVLETEEYAGLNPAELDRSPTLVRHEGSAPAHAPLFHDPQRYAWVVVLEINKVPVVESPEFTPGPGDTEVLFRLPPLSSFISERKVVVDVKLLCTKFFNRESLSRKTLSLK